MGTARRATDVARFIDISAVATRWLPGQGARWRWAALSGVMLAALAVATRIASAGPVEDAFHKTLASTATPVDHAPWTKLLAAYVKPRADGLNLVDYARFKAEGRAALKSYLADLQAADPTKFDRNQQFAYWANLYNAKTVDLVLEAYPVTSIKDIKLGNFLASGPWSKKVLKVSAVDLSLDDIEHTILRPYFKDPRVHYAVNCASIGCPNLGLEAFTGDKLEAQLDAAARAYVNHPRGFRATARGIEASKIYNWFQADFGGSDAGVLSHGQKYANGALKEALAKATSLSSFEYDWKLNDVAR